MKNKKNGPKKGFKNLNFSLPSPSGQLPEGRRPEGLGSKNKSSMIAVFGRFCSAVAICGA